jgi:hypothetical protein
MKTETKTEWILAREQAPKNKQWVVVTATIGILSHNPALVQWDETQTSIANRFPDLLWFPVPTLPRKGY